MPGAQSAVSSHALTLMPNPARSSEDGHSDSDATHDRAPPFDTQHKGVAPLHSRSGPHCTRNADTPRDASSQRRSGTKSGSLPPLHEVAVATVRAWSATAMAAIVARPEGCVIAGPKARNVPPRRRHRLARRSSSGRRWRESARRTGHSPAPELASSSVRPAVPSFPRARAGRRWASLGADATLHSLGATHSDDHAGPRRDPGGLRLRRRSALRRHEARRRRLDRRRLVRALRRVWPRRE